MISRFSFRSFFSWKLWFVVFDVDFALVTFSWEDGCVSSTTLYFQHSCGLRQSTVFRLLCTDKYCIQQPIFRHVLYIHASRPHRHPLPLPYHSGDRSSDTTENRTPENDGKNNKNKSVSEYSLLQNLDWGDDVHTGHFDLKIIHKLSVLLSWNCNREIAKGQQTQLTSENDALTREQLFPNSSKSFDEIVRLLTSILDRYVLTVGFVSICPVSQRSSEQQFCLSPECIEAGELFLSP